MMKNFGSFGLFAVLFAVAIFATACPVPHAPWWITELYVYTDETLVIDGYERPEDGEEQVLLVEAEHSSGLAKMNESPLSAESDGALTMPNGLSMSWGDSSYESYLPSDFTLRFDLQGVMDPDTGLASYQTVEVQGGLSSARLWDDWGVQILWEGPWDGAK